MSGGPYDPNPVTAKTTVDDVAAFRSQMTALIAHLTKTAQVELGTNHDLRRQLAGAEALDAAQRLLIDRLRAACARAEGEVDTWRLMAGTADDKVKALATALTGAQRTCVANDALLIADLLAHRSWRGTAPWRRLGRLWARTIKHRSLRRKLAGHFNAPWFVREYSFVGLLGQIHSRTSWLMALHGSSIPTRASTCAGISGVMPTSPALGYIP